MDGTRVRAGVAGIPAYAQIILDSLAWHRQHRRWALYAYVLMPNHLHAIVKPLGEQTISRVLQPFGSFTAHAILESWHLAPERADYVYSSACFYDRGVVPVVGVDDVREWLV